MILKSGSIFERFITKINDKPIIVIGNQKSGTTVIAALLAKYGDLSATLDINSMTADEQIKLHKKEMNFKKFVYRHRSDFRSDIIKEPALTFLYETIRNTYPKSQIIFILRDPRDNIRSILNRLDLPGDMDAINNYSKFSNLWQQILNSDWLGFESKNYVESLSKRWNLATKTYLDNKNDMVFAKYENFISNKEYFINKLAEKVGIEKKQEIIKEVDVQYQHKGQRNVKWDNFFGKNLYIINEVCKEYIIKFYYKLDALEPNGR